MPIVKLKSVVEYRVQMQLTQSEIAKKLGVSVHSIHGWEKISSPNPAPVTILKLLELMSGGKL